ncbi:hypothetical protein T492DRAFT_1084983 [Pavlovales sp. CCMP2436]|nr:hypothetical protein T492DRAFT_1084983 [Pavlovales sp. CCMP2436]
MPPEGGEPVTPSTAGGAADAAGAGGSARLGEAVEAGEGVRLGEWLRRQRSARAAGLLSAAHAHALEALGVAWGSTRDARWELHLAALVAFHAREGHWAAPREHTEGALKLGVWLHSQRTNQRKGVLSAARTAQLAPYFNTERAAIARSARPVRAPRVRVPDTAALTETFVDAAAAAAGREEASAASVDDAPPETAAPTAALGEALVVAAAAAANANAANVTDGDSLSRPPGSFKVLLEQAVRATQQGLADGLRFLEVEFPPLPQRQLADATSRALEDANVRLALSFATGLGMQVAVAVPDAFALERALALTGGRASPFPNVRLHALTTGYGGAEFPEAGIPIIGRLFMQRRLVVAPWAEAYVLVLSTSAELAEAQELAQREGKKPLIFFNNRLDSLRGELGLPTFPRRALQHRFLSFVRPAYLFLSRSYSASLTRPPYVLPFAGALYRVYPESYQALYDTGKGTYLRVSSNAARPALSEFRGELVGAMREELLLDESALLTRFFAAKTWFEQDARREDLSESWRS